MSDDSKDNGVEVNYTGHELFRITSSDGSYDGKISAKGNGSFDVYTTRSGWKDHSHTHYDSNGNKTYDRPEGSSHSWSHRQKDFALRRLQTLSFENLQYIEKMSSNDYLKAAARHFMTFNDSEERQLAKIRILTR